MALADRAPPLRELGEDAVQRGVEVFRGEVDTDLVVVQVEQPDLFLVGLLLDDRHRAVALGIERGGDPIGIGGTIGRCRRGERPASEAILLDDESRRRRGRAHLIGRGATLQPCEMHDALGDSRLDDRLLEIGRLIDRDLGVDRVAEEPLVAGRERGETGVAEIGAPRVALLIEG